MVKKLKHAAWHVLRVIQEVALIVRKPRYTGKVFCIGFNKTGTTSLGKSLQMLGYRHSSYNKKVWRKYYGNNEIVKILKYTAKFDSFDDLPWLKEDMIPVLDRVFPNSKFIYLVRDEASWQRSYVNWTFQKTGVAPDVEEGLERYRRHRAFVTDYFQDQPADRFLTLDVRDEEGFRKLADFLGKKATLKKIPHFNKTVVTRKAAVMGYSGGYLRYVR